MKEKIQDYQDEFRKELEDHPKKLEASKFLGKMLLAGAFFQLILFLDPSTYFFQEKIASVTGSILNILGYQFSVEGIRITGGAADYLITRDCLGWKSIAVFAALVIATPRMKKIGKILLTGTAILLAANIFRVTSTIILAEKGVLSFDLIHTFLWRWGMSFTVLALWFFWFSGHFSLQIKESLNKSI